MSLLHIKNMVCARCLRTVNRLASEAGLAAKSIQLGEIQLDAAPAPEQLAAFRKSLETEGFELLDDRNSRLVEQVKTLVIGEIHHAAGRRAAAMNFSEFLARETLHEYGQLSRLFSAVEGVTIEKFVIAQKIERAKELLLYDADPCRNRRPNRVQQPAAFEQPVPASDRADPFAVQKRASAARAQAARRGLTSKFHHTFAAEMKKTVCIFLAIQVLAASSPTGQGVQFVFKLGAFAHHFAHHLFCHQEKIGIVDFVQLHYSDHEHHEQDHAEHENLPFQHHHHDQQNLAPQVLFLLPPQPDVLGFFRADNFANPPIPHAEQRLFSRHLSDIWQPPKA